jgi:prepilin-type N-terminal cleavage/methylation domain-containing protein
MNRRTNSHFKNGFTIIELIIVVIIIGILATIVLVAYNGIQANARDKSVASDIDTLDGIETDYGTKNNVAGLAWYSGPSGTNGAANPALGFTPSDGNIIDIVVNGTDYCIRAYNPKSNHATLSNALTKESSPGVCSALPASAAALADSPAGPNTYTNITWTQQTSAGSRLWKAVASSSNGTKLVAVDNSPGYIYTSTDSGATWTARTSAGSKTWGAIYSSSDGTELVAGDTNGYSGGYLYTSTDSGATWTQRTSAGSHYWYNIVGSSDGTKLAASAQGGGYLYTSTDSGATWTEQTAAGTKSWDTIASSSDGTKLIAGDEDGYLYTSTNSGASWTQRTGAGTGEWYGVTSSSDGSKLMAADYYGNGDGSGGYIYTSTDSGATWTQQTSAGKNPWVSAAASSDGSKLILTTLFSDTIATSADFGATWTARTAPVGYAIQKDIASSSDGTRLISFGDVTSYSAPGYIRIGVYN